MTKNFFSRQGRPFSVVTQPFGVATERAARATKLAVCATERAVYASAHLARDSVRIVSTVCTRQACDNALCCALFGGHCLWILSRILFIDTVQKKEKSTKYDPQDLGRHKIYMLKENKK